MGWLTAVVRQTQLDLEPLAWNPHIPVFSRLRSGVSSLCQWQRVEAQGREWKPKEQSEGALSSFCWHPVSSSQSPGQLRVRVGRQGKVTFPRVLPEGGLKNGSSMQSVHHTVEEIHWLVCQRVPAARSLGSS